MSEFTFNLNGLNISQAGGLPQIPAGLSNLGGSLYSGTADADLTYTGNDTIVWDRVNAERLKRGLPGLAEIGYPRPADDAAPAADTPAGTETFKIKGPPGMTLEQARAVFEQQVKTGGVVGFAPGDTLSAATQAFDGLEAAKAQFSQSLGGMNGNLPIGTNLQTLAKSVGPGGVTAAGQIGSFATGAVAAVNSFRVNATGFASSSEAIGGLNQALGLLPTVPGEVNAALTRDGADISTSIKNFTGDINNVVGKTVSTISNVLKGTPTDGIGVADLSKAVTALGPLPGLDQNQVTATLAQAQKLAGQKFDQMTNNAGIGAFGFDATQLEKAGLVKPGTAAEFLAQGKNELLEVLKSPSVWTGKEGVTKVQDFLGNPSLQSKIQQGLMKTGLSDLKQLGVPTDKMTPQALSGLATNSAKSVQDTFKWAQNNPDLPPSLKEQFDKAAVNSAFATNLADNKVEEPVLKEKVIEPSENTVNSATVDAAAGRVVGNDKVPDVTSGTSTDSSYQAVFVLQNFVNERIAQFTALKQKITTTASSYQAITQEQWNVINGEAVAIRATIRARAIELVNAATVATENIPTSGQTYAQKTALRSLNYTLETALAEMNALSDEIRQLIKDLANKIYTQAIRTQNLGA